jgi:hypothetical protein
VKCGDLDYAKEGRPLWRMTEEEDGLYLVNLINNNRFKLSMERQ